MINRVVEEGIFFFSHSLSFAVFTAGWLCVGCWSGLVAIWRSDKVSLNIFSCWTNRLTGERKVCIFKEDFDYAHQTLVHGLIDIRLIYVRVDLEINNESLPIKSRLHSAVDRPSAGYGGELIGGKKLADNKSRRLLAALSNVLFTFFVDFDTDWSVIWAARGEMITLVGIRKLIGSL